jgi:hypothetical protein
MTDPAEPVPLKGRGIAIEITRTAGGHAGIRVSTRQDFDALCRAAYGPGPGLP